MADGVQAQAQQQLVEARRAAEERHTWGEVQEEVLAELQEALDELEAEVARVASADDPLLRLQGLIRCKDRRDALSQVSKQTTAECAHVMQAGFSDADSVMVPIVEQLERVTSKVDATVAEELGTIRSAIAGMEALLRNHIEQMDAFMSRFMQGQSVPPSAEQAQAELKSMGYVATEAQIAQALAPDQLKEVAAALRLLVAELGRVGTLRRLGGAASIHDLRISTLGDEFEKTTETVQVLQGLPMVANAQFATTVHSSVRGIQAQLAAAQASYEQRIHKLEVELANRTMQYGDLVAEVHAAHSFHQQASEEHSGWSYYNQIRSGSVRTAIGEEPRPPKGTPVALSTADGPPVDRMARVALQQLDTADSFQQCVTRLHEMNLRRDELAQERDVGKPFSDAVKRMLAMASPTATRPLDPSLGSERTTSETEVTLTFELPTIVTPCTVVVDRYEVEISESGGAGGWQLAGKTTSAQFTWTGESPKPLFRVRALANMVTHEGERQAITTEWSAVTQAPAPRPVSPHPPPPIVVLYGDAEMRVDFGATFHDPGARETTDGLDITQSAGVDTRRAGAQDIEYTATNSKGVTASIQRRVVVADAPPSHVVLNGAAQVIIDVGGDLPREVLYDAEGARELHGYNIFTTCTEADSGNVVNITDMADESGSYNITYWSDTPGQGHPGPNGRVVRSIEVLDPDEEPDEPDEPDILDAPDGETVEEAIQVALTMTGMRWGAGGKNLASTKGKLNEKMVKNNKKKMKRIADSMGKFKQLHLNIKPKTMGGSKALANARAHHQKEYLMKVHNIPGSRITILDAKIRADTMSRQLRLVVTKKKKG